MSAITTYNYRGVTPARLGFLSVILVTLFYFRDTWLPQGAPPTQSVTYKPHPLRPAPSATWSHATTWQTTPAAAPFDEESGDVFLHHSPAVTTPVEEHSSNHTMHEDCLDLPGGDKVLVMLKTGATELYQKLPTHFLTTLRCVPDFMIFSDLAQNFADIPIYDAIAPVSTKWRDEHEDFELYRKLELWQKEGQDLGKLKGDGGWNLDKWKFMPMLHKAFESADDGIEWFVMIEADTSLSWTNLLMWLKTMDPKKPYYLGAQNWIGETTFAHGGSGIVMSRKAADTLEAARQNIGPTKYDEQWEEATSKSCCGDEIVARAFMAVDIPLTKAWPLIQGESISTVDFTDNHWCTPPVTWHHVSPIQVDAMYQFQMEWVDAHGWETPYLYRDVFGHFIERHIDVNRTSWNNLSKDHRYARPDLQGNDDAKFDELEAWEKKAVESESACAAACVEKGDGECVQWMYISGRCQLGKDIRFGSSDERGDEHFKSGWIQERVEKFKTRMEGCEIRWEG